ncbi:APC family permease [Acidithiobacillus sp. VAN18-1]|uniref:APC family permease n=1 Tax=Igneacidithiobacillus copahuensis TaxID=2724909 RepID=A0AAE2YQ30_9PROT|nr:APC family permease [Igneacidithiobacillus copahuensis]MBU2787868.1 APC family permease [Igneacidithiobacillus copahuensis]MBU2795484.1 APC family permease [Acidithiobacillus sp. VAN18-2]
MTENTTLHKDVVSFWGLVGQSISGMAPTCDVVAFMTAGAAFALVAMPLSYLAAFLLMFIEVNTIYHLTKHRGSAGGYYSFVSAGLGPRAAMLTGFMVIFYQTLSVGGIPVYVGGVFLPALARSNGIALPSWFWIISILFFIGVPWLLSIAGIRPSIRVVALTSLLEIIFLVGSSLFIISQVAPTQPWAPFDATAVGFKGVAMGMIFAITSFIGIGSHTPLGEEARGVRTQNGRVIGKAALVSLTLVGAALVLSAYALTVGWGIHDMQSFARNGAPGVVVFQRYLGFWGAAALVILAINSAMADGLALLNGSARVLFAIARDRLLHTRFAIVNGQRAPQAAINLLAGLALSLAILFGLLFGPSNGFNVMTTAVLIGLVTAHTLMNVALIRLPATGDAWLTRLLFHLLLPIVATLLFWWVLWESLIPLAYPLGWSLALWFAALLPALFYTQLRARKLSAERGRKLGIVESSGS